MSASTSHQESFIHPHPKPSEGDAPTSFSHVSLEAQPALDDGSSMPFPERGDSLHYHQNQNHDGKAFDTAGPSTVGTSIACPTNAAPQATTSEVADVNVFGFSNPLLLLMNLTLAPDSLPNHLPKSVPETRMLGALIRGIQAGSRSRFLRRRLSTGDK
ncbi:hypothetical protein K440DRAFT_640790 [Wilcoxina mikolae CBS 423.85]|nr:hypothetical protein K440DRAFT_640790 [Wilcoxina mikolae CBS 423.85]